jgi:iron complex outermembrane receptor protein
MRSPFTPAGLGGPAQQLPLDATPFWAVVQALVPALAATPAPNATQVSSVMRALNPTTRAFNTVADVRDVDPMKPQINNTAEVGYKGFLANKLSLGVDLYYSRIEDFVSPIQVPTPNVFLDRASLTAYLISQGFTPVQAATIAAGVAGIDGNPSVTGIPLGTVTPVNTVGDPYDVFLTYRNFGTVDLWGADLGATFFVTDEWSFTGTYSFVNKNLFKNQDGIADIALNSPMNKATLAANYRDARAGLSAEVRGRYVDQFPMNSGVFVGTVENYMLMDANCTYALAFAPGLDASLTATNVFNHPHREFVGAPDLGRMVMLRVRKNF